VRVRCVWCVCSDKSNLWRVLMVTSYKKAKTVTQKSKSRELRQKTRLRGQNSCCSHQRERPLTKCGKVVCDVCVTIPLLCGDFSESSICGCLFVCVCVFLFFACRGGGAPSESLICPPQSTASRVFILATGPLAFGNFGFDMQREGVQGFLLVPKF